MDVIDTRQTPKCAILDNNYYRSEKNLRGNLVEMNIVVAANFVSKDYRESTFVIISET